MSPTLIKAVVPANTSTIAFPLRPNVDFDSLSVHDTNNSYYFRLWHRTLPFTELLLFSSCYTIVFSPNNVIEVVSLSALFQPPNKTCMKL
jgi:hypothetical protein